MQRMMIPGFKRVSWNQYIHAGHENWMFLKKKISGPEMMNRSEDDAAIREVSQTLAEAKTKGELGQILAAHITRYTLHDLQALGGRLHTELIRLPRPYRDQISPYLTDQIFGAYHQFLKMHRGGRFTTMTEPIADPEIFTRFCEIIPSGCTQWDDTATRLPIPYTLRHRLFYYLIAAFTMFILDQPGHPVGMPFPGGFKVEERSGAFYCLIRDHEKEVPYSLCNYCPALQNEENP